VATISAATIQEQDPHQVTQILNEIPGIILTPSSPLTSTNIAAGILSTTEIPQIRGALPYETQSLIDGHPVSVGFAGSFSPLFVNPNQLQSIEVVKGPGATPVDINYAVGGSVNYITLQPTAKPHFSFDIDEDSYGGTSTNVNATGTTAHDKLGYAFALGIDGTPGPWHNYPAPGAVTLVNSGASAYVNGVPICGTLGSGTGCFQSNVNGPANLNGLPIIQFETYACCDLLQSQYLARTELGKIRYSLSETTSLTIAYLGGQATSAFAQTFEYPQTYFVPPAGYTGSVPAGLSIPLGLVTYYPTTLSNTQGLVESELRTSIGKASLLFRYYAGASDSNTINVPFGQPYSFSTNLWGGTPNASGGTTYFNDTPSVITVNGAGQANVTTDHYDGLSGELDVPAGDNTYSLSYDRTRHSSFDENLYDDPSADTTIIPAGSSQAFSTYMLRGAFALGSRVNLTLANYFINYATHYTPDGGVTWADATSSHYLPRLAITDRVSADSILRFSAGSSIAPPYLSLVTTQGGAPQPNVEGAASYYTLIQNTGTISPESAFGYDLGADHRLGRDTVLSGDLYFTTLHGQFLVSTTTDGIYTSAAGATSGTAPLFLQQTQNLGSSRYEGIELSLRHTPQLGVGYKLQGSMERAFAYNLPPGFYDTGAGPDTTNLAVIPNINFQPSGLTFNGLSSRIPYATAYGEISYRWKRAYALLGATYFGVNNAYNQPPFGVLNGTIGVNLGPTTSLQLTANNITSAYSSTAGSLQGGIPVPLVGGQFGAVPGITIGPSNFRLVLREKL
jgi:hypothetical protein